MKLGFTLKKPKKPSLATSSGNGSGSSAFAAAAPAAAPSQAREFVTSFDPNAVALDASGVAKRTLVIPLLRANAWAGRTSTGNEAETIGTTSSEPTADEVAARALLADAVRGTSDANPSANATLVIPMSSLPPPPQPLSRDTGGAPKADEKDEKRQVRARLFAEKPHAPATTAKSAAQVPILRQNAVPGLDALADANDKYRLDVSLRPDALDVHSDAYALVPVEDFGAALLRGMGWKGNDDVATGTSTSGTIAAPKPRHKLLGLGATARPPMPGDASKKRHGKLRVGTSSGQPEESSRRRPDEARSSSPPPQPLRQSGLNHTESSRARERDDARDRRASPSPSRDARRDERRSSQKHGSQSSASRNDSKRSRSRSRERRHRSDERRKRSRSRESRRDDDRKRTSRR